MPTARSRRSGSARGHDRNTVAPWLDVAQDRAARHAQRGRQGLVPHRRTSVDCCCGNPLDRGDAAVASGRVAGRVGGHVQRLARGEPDGVEASPLRVQRVGASMQHAPIGDRGALIGRDSQAPTRIPARQCGVAGVNSRHERRQWAQRARSYGHTSSRAERRTRTPGGRRRCARGCRQPAVASAGCSSPRPSNTPRGVGSAIAARCGRRRACEAAKNRVWRRAHHTAAALPPGLVVEGKRPGGSPTQRCTSPNSTDDRQPLGSRCAAEAVLGGAGAAGSRRRGQGHPPRLSSCRPRRA